MSQQNIRPNIKPGFGFPQPPLTGTITPQVLHYLNTWDQQRRERREKQEQERLDAIRERGWT